MIALPLLTSLLLGPGISQAAPADDGLAQAAGEEADGEEAAEAAPKPLPENVTISQSGRPILAGDDEAQEIPLNVLEIDYCGTPRKGHLQNPAPVPDTAPDFLIEPRKQVGFVRGGQSLVLEDLAAYGWSVAWTEGGYTWFNLPDSLDQVALQARVQEGFSCETVGGDGLVETRGMLPVKVVLRDARFKTSTGVGVGSSEAAARRALCEDECKDTPMQHPTQGTSVEAGPVKFFIDAASGTVTEMEISLDPA